MTNRLFTACMTAWSEAFARALAPTKTLLPHGNDGVAS